MIVSSVSTLLSRPLRPCNRSWARSCRHPVLCCTHNQAGLMPSSTACKEVCLLMKFKLLSGLPTTAAGRPETIRSQVSRNLRINLNEAFRLRVESMIQINCPPTSHATMLRRAGAERFLAIGRVDVRSSWWRLPRQGGAFAGRRLERG